MAGFEETIITQQHRNSTRAAITNQTNQISFDHHLDLDKL